MCLEDIVLKIITREGDNLRRRAISLGLDVTDVKSYMEWQLPIIMGKAEALYDWEVLQEEILKDDVV